MRRVLTICAAAAALLACGPEREPAPMIQASPPPAERPAAGPDATPLRGDPPPLPAADAVLTRIALGSCSEETQELPIFAAVERVKPDLFLYIGDNVYGDARAGDMNLPELRQAYADLAMNAHFSAFNMAVPMLATWDDHDYGLNDAGGDFPGKALSETLFETFWRDAAVGVERPGVYGAKTFGPPGRRVQIILLDTRFFRSPLKRTDAYGAPGKERWLPDPDPTKTLLGAEQWAWLRQELAKPAEIRLLVSSIQVLADGHGWEAWRLFPAEQARLHRTIAETGAKGVVLLSGDRHVAALYRQPGPAGYPLHELTASSLNRPFVESDAEMSSNQIGRVYTPVNFGLVEIDWAGRTVELTVRGLDGAPQRRLTVPFRDLGYS